MSVDTRSIKTDEGITGNDAGVLALVRAHPTTQSRDQCSRFLQTSRSFSQKSTSPSRTKSSVLEI